MLDDKDSSLSSATLNNINWQIEKIDKELDYTIKLVNDMEEKKLIMKGFSGKIISEILLSLLATLLAMIFLVMSNLYLVLYFKYLVPLITFVLSLVVWVRIRNDYFVCRDNNYVDLEKNIAKLKVNISNLQAKKIELVEMKNIVINHVLDSKNNDLQQNIPHVVRYDDDKEKTSVKKKSLNNKKH